MSPLILIGTDVNLQLLITMYYSYYVLFLITVLLRIIATVYYNCLETFEICNLA
jgi:hypothetical protein